MDDMGLPRGTRARCRQAQHLIPGQLSNHPAVRASGIDIDGANNGMFLPDRGANAASNINRTSPMARHQGSHKEYNDAVRSALDRIDLSRGQQHVATEIARMQNFLRQQQYNGLPIRSADMSVRFTPGGTATGTERVRSLWDKTLRSAGF